MTVHSHESSAQMPAQVEIVGPHGGEVVLPGPNGMRIVFDSDGPPAPEVAAIRERYATYPTEETDSA
jgi:hypothetical protein